MKPQETKSIIGTLKVRTPEEVAGLLEERLPHIQEQIRRLEEAKKVTWKTMQIEVTI